MTDWNVSGLQCFPTTSISEWGGVDTIHVCAGVSALRPLLEVAGSQTTSKEDIDEEAISNTVSIARKAVHGNYEGPMVVALTFVGH